MYYGFYLLILQRKHRNDSFLYFGSQIHEYEIDTGCIRNVAAVVSFSFTIMSEDEIGLLSGPVCCGLFESLPTGTR